jgi:hypothetical protein
MNKETKNEKLTTAQKLELILPAIEDPIVAEEIRAAFFLTNPLGFAKLAYARELPVEVMRELLRLKVDEKPEYQFDVQPLVDRAFAELWQKLAESVK